MLTASTRLRIVVLCVAAIASTLAKSCETEDYEDGVCVPQQKCDTFKNVFAQSGLSASQRRLLQREQEKCSSEEENGLICCKRKPRPTIPRSYEDVQPLVKGNRNLLPDKSTCGLDSADRIYFGNVTNLDQYPWLALIKYIDSDEKEFFKCGGSLINDRYVLTAAHCINKFIAEVRLGEWDLETDPDCVITQDIKQCAPSVLDVSIEKIIMHKNYTRRASKGGKIDLALLRLDQSVAFGRYVAPVCLPLTEAEAQLSEDHKLFVAGWGMTEDHVTSSKKLFVDVSHVGLDECRRAINAPLIKLDETIICALGKEGKDACQGDSGGPLMEIKETEDGVLRFFLEGIVSKGLACGSTKPGFYTNVYRQLNWIISNMEP